jgi:hypothetical protein
MGASRRPGFRQKRLHVWILPPRTPGVLGMCDASDPNCTAELGDTPGSLGVGDWGDPMLRLRLLTKPRQRGLSRSSSVVLKTPK